MKVYSLQPEGMADNITSLEAFPLNQALGMNGELVYILGVLTLFFFKEDGKGIVTVVEVSEESLDFLRLNYGVFARLM